MKVIPEFYQPPGNFLLNSKVSYTAACFQLCMIYIFIIIYVYTQDINEYAFLCMYALFTYGKDLMQCHSFTHMRVRLHKLQWLYVHMSLLLIK